jgi:hypothetical protein
MLRFSWKEHFAMTTHRTTVKSDGKTKKAVPAPQSGQHGQRTHSDHERQPQKAPARRATDGEEQAFDAPGAQRPPADS